MTPSLKRAMIALGLLSLVSAIAVAGSGPAAGALFTLPLALVVLPLLFDRGQDLIDRLARSPRSASRRRILPGRAADPAAPQLVLPRGGLLIAASLAVRPPPLPSLSA